MLKHFFCKTLDGLFYISVLQFIFLNLLMQLYAGIFRRGNRNERRNKLQDYIRVPPTNANNSQDYYQGGGNRYPDKDQYDNRQYNNRPSGKEYQYGQQQQQRHPAKDTHQGSYSSSPRENLSQDDNVVHYRDGYHDNEQPFRGRGGVRGRGQRGRGSNRGGYTRDNRDEHGPPRYGGRGRGRDEGFRNTYSSLRNDRDTGNRASPRQDYQQQPSPRQQDHASYGDQDNERGYYQNNERQRSNPDRQSSGRGAQSHESRHQAQKPNPPATTIIESDTYLDEDIIPPMTTPYAGTTTTRTQAINNYNDRQGEARKKKVGTTRVQEYEGGVEEREDRRPSAARELQHGGYSEGG